MSFKWKKNAKTNISIHIVTKISDETYGKTKSDVRLTLKLSFSQVQDQVVLFVFFLVYFVLSSLKCNCFHVVTANSSHNQKKKIKKKY